MEENKVVLSLQEYLKLYDNSKEIDNTLKELKHYLFNAFEYNKEKNIMKFDKYNLSDVKMTNLIKKLFPDEFENQLNLLRGLEDE